MNYTKRKRVTLVLSENNRKVSIVTTEVCGSRSGIKLLHFLTHQPLLGGAAEGNKSTTT